MYIIVYRYSVQNIKFTILYFISLKYNLSPSKSIKVFNNFSTNLSRASRFRVHDPGIREVRGNMQALT